MAPETRFSLRDRSRSNAPGTTGNEREALFIPCPMTDAYCRSCHSTFARPLPAPYGSICPSCMARGDIVTLTDAPRRRLTGRLRDRGVADRKSTPGAMQLGQIEP